MKTKLSANDRELRIELLRARAAIERRSLMHNAKALSEDLTPSALIKGVLPKFVSKGGAPDLLAQGLSLVQRYPFIVSSASALLSRKSNKRHRWLRLVAGLLLSWQVARAFGNSKS